MSVSLSRGSTQLHCAKMAGRIKMLFGVITRGGPWSIVGHGGPDTPIGVGTESWGKFCRISEMAGARDLKLCRHINGTKEKMQK